MASAAIGTTSLGEKRMSVRVGKSVNDPPLDIMFPEEKISHGRLATIPDIVDVLLNHQLEKVSLPPYITTMSAEYAGLSRTGIPLIVVAHGVGPMATPKLARGFYDGASNRLAYKERGFLKRILAEKNSPYERDEDIIQWRAYNNLRVQCLAQDPKFQREFWKLCDGDYGQVEIVEMRTLGRSLKKSFHSLLLFEEIYENPLVRARLGSRAEEFLLYVRNKDMRSEERKTQFPIFACAQSTYDSLDRYADLQRGPVGYLLCMRWMQESQVSYFSTGFWSTGSGARFVHIQGDGPLTEIRSGFGDVRF
ncbi:hypothetical protein HYW94_03080 [Candidatus Uhrbacteria bacterium]|nr:hypothetical protein [Candidatus Uhrbacteria bacterium]